MNREIKFEENPNTFGTAIVAEFNVLPEIPPPGTKTRRAASREPKLSNTSENGDSAASPDKKPEDQSGKAE